jgi:hypothetical protein
MERVSLIIRIHHRLSHHRRRRTGLSWGLVLVCLREWRIHTDTDTDTATN